MSSRRKGAVPVLVLALLAGCTIGSEVTPTGAGSRASSELSGVCPNPVVIQTDWNPQSGYGWTYNLIGGKYRYDDQRKRVTGELVTAEGRSTGVDIEVRAGGPAVDFADPGELLYRDPTITLAYVSQDSQVAQYGKYPTQMVVAPQTISSQIVMWDESKWLSMPNFGKAPDNDIQLHTLPGANFAAWLVSVGLLKQEQWHQDYDGTTKAWVQSGGVIAQQGFIDAEPFLYRKQFGADVRAELLYDMGYKVYSQALGIRSGDAENLGPCLRRLVPLVQRSQVAFQADPSRANALIVNLASRWMADTGWSYPPELAAYSVKAQRDNGLVSVDKEGRVGQFDMARVRDAADLVSLALAVQRRGPGRASRPRAEQLATNEYVDPAIRIPVPGVSR